MNETEISLLTKERLLEMYENAVEFNEQLCNQVCEMESTINELEAEVEYWRDAYYDLKEKDD